MADQHNSGIPSLANQIANDIPDIKENLEFHKDVFESILTAWSDTDASVTIDLDKIDTISAYAKTILDDADEATFKETVNLEIGTDVQAYHALLTAIAALTPTDGNIIVGDGTTFVAESGSTAMLSLGITAFAQTILDDADADEVKATLGITGNSDLEIETGTYTGNGNSLSLYPRTVSFTTSWTEVLFHMITEHKETDGDVGLFIWFKGLPTDMVIRITGSATMKDNLLQTPTTASFKVGDDGGNDDPNQYGRDYDYFTIGRV